MQTSDPFVATLQRWIEMFMHRSMRDLIFYSKEAGLSMSQIGTLFHIYHGPKGVSNIGDELGVTSAAASQMLERLVNQGLVNRTEAPQDRRAKQIVLTEKGLRILHESLRARQGWMGELSNNLSASEKDQVITALNILTEKAAQLQ